MPRTKSPKIKNEYELDMEIDLSNLHEEWLKQPMLMTKYSSLHAEAKADADEAHEHVKIVRSELIAKCKQKNPKMTQQQVEAWYRTHKKHRRAKKRQIRAELERDLMYAAVQSIQHRKSALENLVKLHGQEYFSVPSDSNAGAQNYTRDAGRKVRIRKSNHKRR